jgi:SAM-dependent methyltransferase
MKTLRVIRSVLQELGLKGQRPDLPNISEAWSRLQDRLNKADRIIDLGSGADPHPRAIVAADAFLKPLHRSLGQGPELTSEVFKEKGIPFIQADLCSLPFADKCFDFAYSHHVFEHLMDPKKACSEISRIAKAGAIVTPSIFAEVAFGRPYHRWFVVSRGEVLVFIRKSQDDNQPFGEHPLPRKEGGYRVTKQTNPFDILLNERDWYQGNEGMPRLSRPLRHYWASHSPVMEVVFLWEGSFNCVVVQEDGRLE